MLVVAAAAVVMVVVLFVEVVPAAIAKLTVVSLT